MSRQTRQPNKPVYSEISHTKQSHFWAQKLHTMEYPWHSHLTPTYCDSQYTRRCPWRVNWGSQIQKKTHAVLLAQTRSGHCFRIQIHNLSSRHGHFNRPDIFTMPGDTPHTTAQAPKMHASAHWKRGRTALILRQANLANPIEWELDALTESTGAARLRFLMCRAAWEPYRPTTTPVRHLRAKWSANSRTQLSLPSQFIISVCVRWCHVSPNFVSPFISVEVISRKSVSA